MYALMYKAGSFLGLFSTKKKMTIIIETLIKDDYEKTGHYGNFNFRWVKLNVDEPWFTKNGKDAPQETNAIVSLFTMHDEKFTHKVKTDWSTGKIISLDGDSTTNVNER